VFVRSLILGSFVGGLRAVPDEEAEAAGEGEVAVSLEELFRIGKSVILVYKCYMGSS